MYSRYHQFNVSGVAAKPYPHQSYFGVSYDPAKHTHLAITKTIAYQNSNYLSIFLFI